MAINQAPPAPDQIRRQQEDAARRANEQVRANAVNRAAAVTTNKVVLDPGKNARGPVDVTPNPVPPKPPAPTAPPAPAKTAFDLQRDQVAVDRMAEEKRRVEAVERMLSNRGLGDSGILAGAERAERANVAQEAGRAMSSINQQEAQQTFAAGEAEKDRAISREGLAQAKELALAGLDIQKTSLALQEKGMSQQQAQFTASLAQADKHAQMGFTLQESAQDLTRQGMDIQQAQFTASLGQARYLAEKGFSIEATRTELQRQGLDQQQAQFVASQAHQEKLLGIQDAMDIRKGIFIDAIGKLDPKSPDYLAGVYKISQAFGMESAVFPGGPPSAQPSAPPSGPGSTISRGAGNIGEGNIITGTGQVLGGAAQGVADAFGVPVGAVEGLAGGVVDASGVPIAGVANVAKKVLQSFGL